MSGSVEGSLRRYRIGYAMAPNKSKTIFRDSLIHLASNRGIDLVPVDLRNSLIRQGPFDAVVHKLYSQDWRNQLAEFSAQNPAAVIIDPLDNIQKLHNRITMLQVVNNLPLSLPPQGLQKSIAVPKQVFVDTSSAIRIASEDLGFPLIAKPLLADGTEGCHKMCLVFNKNGLNELEPPLVLQQFVNHGGVVFKVYVAGDHVRCVKRSSLPDISAEKLKATSENLLPFSRISNLTDQDQSDDSVEKLIEEAEMPPSSLVTEMADALRKALNLNLFNLDMIRDSNDPNRYLVIDINYFPGYAKMPCYEAMLTDFFVDVVKHKQIY